MEVPALSGPAEADKNKCRFPPGFRPCKGRNQEVVIAVTVRQTDFRCVHLVEAMAAFDAGYEYDVMDAWVDVSQFYGNLLIVTFAGPILVVAAMIDLAAGARGM